MIIEWGQGRVESLKARALWSVHRAKVTQERTPLAFRAQLWDPHGIKFLRSQSHLAPQRRTGVSEAIAVDFRPLKN